MSILLANTCEKNIIQKSELIIWKLIIWQLTSSFGTLPFWKWKFYNLADGEHYAGSTQTDYAKQK